ncbi:hypothetical protein SORBI_3001G454850 [Sorghum bicolor]|uniref:Uncharacterized protein n=1 Tax=Sorghum bicolor TaxID=4558 RepID=A0A1Z5SB10_SORBI|nr:hypothetical protein SORBI_3001G454850 [Sorghum bicolor]
MNGAASDPPKRQLLDDTSGRERCAVVWPGRRQGPGSWRPRGARVNKAYFFRYCDSALDSNSAKQTARGSPRIRRALEPSRDRKYTRTRAAHAFVASSPLPFAICVAGSVWMLPALSCFCLCMPPIYRATQPANPGKASEQHSSSSSSKQRSPRLASVPRRPDVRVVASFSVRPEVRAHTPPCHDHIDRLPLVPASSSAFEHHRSVCRTFWFSASSLAFARRDRRSVSIGGSCGHSEPWTVAWIARNVRHHKYKVRDHTAAVLL